MAHLRLVQELRIREILPPLPKHVYGVVWKYSDNIAFYTGWSKSLCAPDYYNTIVKCREIF